MPHKIIERPEVLLGETHKLKMIGTTEITIYLTINCIDKKPYEIFINTKNAEMVEHMIAITKLVSKWLQKGLKVKEISSIFLDISSPFTSHMKKGGICKSMYARIGETLLLYKEK